MLGVGGSSFQIAHYFHQLFILRAKCDAVADETSNGWQNKDKKHQFDCNWVVVGQNEQNVKQSDSEHLVPDYLRFFQFVVDDEGKCEEEWAKKT